MAVFELSAKVNDNNVFLVKHSELEGRWDIDYYRPKINALEKKIRQKTTKKLKDFIVKIASGATPSVQEEAKFYSTKENGIPFLRVQNLNVSGELSLDDVKYINQETHNNYLKRSQVSEHDLLVKITGVGRMAIASVAPSGFDGNTNQHMVVIKTGGEEQSRYLANYLNLDIIEALATRRSTGATRPALDYPALKSIPVIGGIDFSFLKKAEAQKQQKEQQAQVLLDSIDGYLLNALGITLPQQDSRLEKRMFTVPFSEVIGGRLDPVSFSSFGKYLFSSIYSYKPLHQVAQGFGSGFGVGKDNQAKNSDGIIQIRPTNINSYGDLIFQKNVYLPKEYTEKYEMTSYGDVLFNNTNSQDLVGKTAIFLDKDNQYFYSNHITVIKTNALSLNPDYLKNVLNLYQEHKYFYSICTNWNNQSGVGTERLKAVKIPVPPIAKQTEIATHITQIRTQAKQLQLDAANLLATTKADIERMILGESA